MRQKHRNKNALKNLPFYSEEIKSVKKKNKKISNIKLLSELPFCYKKPKKLTNIKLSILPIRKKKKIKKIN